jgi:UDP-N-acetylmuramoylalanine--D-glutamate ligase
VKVEKLEGQRVAVVGLGRSGQAAVDLLLAHGALVWVIDDKHQLAEAQALRDRGVEVTLGGFPAGWQERVSQVIVSPGFPLSRPELAVAIASGLPVRGEVELAYRCLPKGAGPILAITGTNGKSTTTALLGDLVAAGGRDTFVGGNLGRPFSEACAAPHAWHVLELSSFQLEGVDSASFLGSALLNLTPDHLDRYDDHEAYGAAKARIFRHQPDDGFAVVNADDDDVVGLSRTALVPVYGFTLADHLWDGHRPHRFQPFAGLAVGKRGGHEFLLMPAAGDELGRERYSVEGVRALRGDHNLMNAMAAVLMARLAGIPADAVRAGLAGFKGLKHRLELVRLLDGVEWVNDSKATNVDSSVVAMNAMRGNVWLIAGGKGKGAPYAPLVQASQGKLKGVLTIGEDARTVHDAFVRACPVKDCVTLKRAVEMAHGLVERGDTVLLSPACASYDQFDNFEHRGETFRRLVEAL